MPYYEFVSPIDETSTKLIFFSFSSCPKIGESIVDEEGVMWKRVASLPNTASNTKYDPYSKKDFVKVTNKNDTLGDLWDRSKEFSLKRKDQDGLDLIKEKYEEKLEKDTGLVSNEKKQRLAREKLKKLKISLKEGKPPRSLNPRK